MNIIKKIFLLSIVIMLLFVGGCNNQEELKEENKKLKGYALKMHANKQIKDQGSFISTANQNLFWIEDVDNTLVNELEKTYDKTLGDIKSAQKYEETLEIDLSNELELIKSLEEAIKLYEQAVQLKLGNNRDFPNSEYINKIELSGMEVNAVIGAVSEQYNETVKKVFITLRGE